ncbi:AAA family ATPase [Pseudomonas xanthosomatis]|uniref:AAA family ATPase n=1 Tax=Pseudomonas xanthosomatis TaxID=2842356 RepID=UPI003516111C
MEYKGIKIRTLEFIGPQVEPIKLEFGSGLNLVYGASNTGKSFALKAIDFMLGGENTLPDLPERKGFDTVLMGFDLIGSGVHTVQRSLSGGAYKFYDGLYEFAQLPQQNRVLQPSQRSKSKESLPGLLLDYLELSGRQLAKNQSGEKENFSFRELIPYVLVDETSIQAERSPVESDLGPVARPKERSVFRSLLTGLDDKSIIPVLDSKKFQASKAVKIEVIQSLLDDVESELESEYTDTSDLYAQKERLDASLEKIRLQLQSYRSLSSDLISEKRVVSQDLSQSLERAEDIRLHLQRFYQLNSIYDSDIARLASIEEASFLLSLEDADCSVCGAPAEAQSIKNQMDKVRDEQYSALVEIEKVKTLQSELEDTIGSLRVELYKIEETIPTLEERIVEIEKILEAQVPEKDERQLSLDEVLLKKDHVVRGVSLLDRRESYLRKIKEYEELKAPSKSDRPDLTVPGDVIHEFCKVVTYVLNEWGFPGEKVVSFDKDKYEVVIDGKLRIDNGKGVRAITHAAFKVALLIYCRQQNLPHPGFIILDSPLLTYRDPLKNPRQGALTEDEIKLAKTSVKVSFFDHLSKISNLGQFIVLENIDPPAGIQDIAHVEVFYGSAGGGRYGLFPMSSSLETQ